MSSCNWVYLGQGRNRIVWRRGNIVVKVPLNWNGLTDNWHERDTWLRERTRGYIPLASCRLYHNYALVMEYVKSYYSGADQMPRWVMSVDCGQVGHNKRGQLLAYDYGIT
jgi:hypothetical protein